MFTNSAGLESALIGLAVLVFFIARQFTTRRVVSVWTVGAPLVLVYFGLQGLTNPDAIAWLLLGINLSLGVALGFARGMTFRVWPDADGQALMRGTMLTLLLWVATFMVRLAASFVEARMGFAVMSGNAAMLLPAAATIAAQTLVVYLRSQDAQLATA
jgi:hypothetical protein